MQEPRTYEQFLKQQNIPFIASSKPEAIQAVVETRNPEKAKEILKSLKALGLKPAIQDGGLSVQIISKEMYNKAESFLATYGLQLKPGTAPNAALPSAS